MKRAYLNDAVVQAGESLYPEIFEGILVTLGLAVLLSVIGAAVLMFSVFGEWGKGKKELRIAVGVAGALILPATLAYILLTFIFFNAV